MNQETTKQETIEEVALKWFMTANKQEIIFDLGWMKIFEAGVKWHEKRSYSEEEVLDILFTMSVDNPNNITKWFEQFKKK